MSTPSRLGKYEVRREIGKGSMGIVYEGFDPMLQRRVAIKVIREIDLDPAQASEMLARLRREAQAAARLSHPNIVAIYDYSDDTSGDDGRGHVAFITMELAEGKELKERFDAKHHFAPQDIEHCMGGILAALQHAHSNGVTHRDIKPANVILLPSGVVKVADFGVARIENSDLTQTGTVMGTPLYMSPEQIMGHAVDGRSDLFACGVMLYQFLTGEKPFTGSVTSLMQKVLHEDPMPPTRRDASLAPEWDKVLGKAMAKSPDDRYQSADEMRAAINRAVAQQETETTLVMPRDYAATIRVPRLQTPPGVSPLKQQDKSPLHLHATPQRRSMNWVLGIAAMALALIVALVATTGGFQFGKKGGAEVAVTSPAPGAALVSEAQQPAIPAAVPEVTPAATQAIAQAPAPRPAPAPAPSAEMAVNPTSTPAPDFGVDWARRVALLDAPSATKSAGAALVVLLDATTDVDRRVLKEIDAAINKFPRLTALALGLGNNAALTLGAATALPGPTSNSPESLQATEATALRRCAERVVAPCQVVQMSGVFRKRALIDLVRNLAPYSVGEVRENTVRTWPAKLDALNKRAEEIAKTSAAAAAVTAMATVAPAPTLAASPPPRPVAETSQPVVQSPSNEWGDAVQRLRAGGGKMQFAEAFATLLNVQSANELAALTQFEVAMKRLRWKSAAAVGEKNGLLGWTYVSAQSSQGWAADDALAQCLQQTSAACVVMMRDGKFIDSALIELAPRLTQKRQAQVREAFIGAIQRNLQRGI